VKGSKRLAEIVYKVRAKIVRANGAKKTENEAMIDIQCPES